MDYLKNIFMGEISGMMKKMDLKGKTDVGKSAVMNITSKAESMGIIDKDTLD